VNKMKTYDYKIVLSVALLLAVIGVLGIVWQQPWKAGASVAVGNQYQSTTTPTMTDLTNLCPPVYRVGMASSTTGILGSVVVTSQNVGDLQIYDATTSNSTLRAVSASSTLLLADFSRKTVGATTTSGTYTFDLEFKSGLLVDYIGSFSTSTITYRCEG